MRRRFRVLGGLGVVSAATTAAVAVHAPAAVAQPCSTPTSSGAGRDHPPDPSISLVTGIAGTIKITGGDLCEPWEFDDNYSAWVMVQTGEASWIFDYAQAGYIMDPFATPLGPQSFAESNRQISVGSYLTEFTLGDQVNFGSSHTYKSVYATECDCIRSYVDGVRLQSSNWDPMEIWEAPWRPQAAAEVHNDGSEIPGQFSNPLQFSNLQFALANGTAVAADLPDAHVAPQHASEWFVSAMYTCNYGSCFHVWGQ